MSMRDGTCDRCHRPTTVFRMSMFNTEMCCKDCLNKEEKRKDYERAREAERNAVLRGDYNFKGIGL